VLAGDYGSAGGSAGGGGNNSDSVFNLTGPAFGWDGVEGPLSGYIETDAALKADYTWIGYALRYTDAGSNFIHLTGSGYLNNQVATDYIEFPTNFDLTGGTVSVYEVTD
jgi:hypothetical protein